ncbi:class Ia ribonucleoside-diphosphate reductase subunit beta [Pseudomonas syringae pv. actinidiae]|nr:class Ia ribonucleoside-diphosphate reductase subunit beta [Pseudomonas syringae pv. actinidiae]
MTYSVFTKTKNNQLKETMFFGQPVNVARYDQSKFPIFLELAERQNSFFWRPHEIDVSKDRIFTENIEPHKLEIFLNNLKYQTLLDSIQGRAPAAALLSIVSLPELENWILTWTFSETIHSKSYTHIIKNLVNNPGVVFDDIVMDKEIRKRAVDISHYYDDLIDSTKVYHLFGEGIHSVNGKKYDTRARTMKKRLYLLLHCINALEAVRFYVSFACTFAFGQEKIFMANTDIMRLIARDEALHLTGTQHMINILASGQDDPEFVDIAIECKAEAQAIFESTVDQEKAWATYLFRNGGIVGLNEMILGQYVEFIAGQRMKAVGLDNPYNTRENPIPWINLWLNSDKMQSAPQERENVAYLISQMNTSLDLQSLRKKYAIAH